MNTHDDYMQKQSVERRAQIEARARELLSEELILRKLRKARALSQVVHADMLGLRQGDVSQFERRVDAYLSTFRRYVESMGGSLDLVASFPNLGPVKIPSIGYLSDICPHEIEEIRVSEVE